MFAAVHENVYRVLDESTVAEALAHYCWPDRIRSDPDGAHGAVDDARAAIARWLALGLPYRRVGITKRFDYYEIIGFMRRMARERGDPVYRDGPLRTFRDAVEELRNRGGRFRVHLRRTFGVCGRPGTGGARFRVPLPIRNTEKMHVQLIEPAAGSFPIVQAPGRLEIRIPAANRTVPMRIELRIELDAPAFNVRVDPGRLRPADVSDPEYALYTRPEEGLIRVTPVIQELAQRLAGGANDAWRVVGEIWRYFFERLCAGPIHHDWLDPADPLGSVLGQGWFDCYTGSCLMVALCRARAIPARVINGFSLYRSIPSNHYWVEVLLPPYGWLPFDLSSWDLALGDRGDREWSECYFGCLDPRLAFQCFPREIIGPIGVRLPRAWYALPRVRGEGLEVAYYALESGQMVYSDWLAIETSDSATAPGNAMHR